MDKPDIPAGIAETVRSLNGPHEWGYRDVADGAFIADNAPFRAAEHLQNFALAVLTYTPRTPSDQIAGTGKAIKRAVAEAAADMQEACARVADAASGANLERSNELRVSGEAGVVVDMECSVAFYRKHREAAVIAADIRALPTPPQSDVQPSQEKGT